MRKNLFLFLIMCLAFNAKSQDTIQTANHTFTLEDCIRYAFDNNFDRRSLDLTQQSQELSYKQSKMDRLPSVSANIGESMSNSGNSSYSGADGTQYNNTAGVRFSGSVGLNASATLYSGGSVNKTIEQNRINYEKSLVQLEQYDDELVINILQAFLSVLSNEELLKYQEFVLNTSRQQLAQGEVKYRTGAILASDYLLLKAQYASDSNNIVDTRISRDNSLLSLKILLSMEPTDELTIIYPDTTSFDRLTVFPTQEEALSEALDYLPSIKSSLYDVSIARNNIGLARANLYPSVRISGGVSTGHSNFDNMGQQFADRLSEQVGISVSVPVFNAFSTRTRIEQNQIALKQAELNHEQNLLSVRQTVVKEYQSMVSAYNKFRVTEITQDAYRQSFEAYNVQFQHGSITAVELLQQQNSYINSVNEYIRSKYSFMLQRKVMDVYMGREITM